MTLRKVRVCLCDAEKEKGKSTTAGVVLFRGEAQPPINRNKESKIVDRKDKEDQKVLIK